MDVVYFSIIPTFEPSRYCKCWIVCFYNKPGCKGEVEIDKNNSDNCGSFYSVLPDRNDKRTAGFPRDEVSDLLTEIKWNQKGKKDYILKRSTQPDVWRRE